MRSLLAACIALSLASSAALAQDGASLQLVSLDGRVQALTPADLDRLGTGTVTVLEDGAEATYRGPDLRGLATLAGAPTGRGLRGPAMTLALLVEGSDGYAVGFMVSELDPQFGARPAIVARSRSGEPLAEADGPWRVVVPDDAFHARWVRGVTRVRLVDVARSASSR